MEMKTFSKQPRDESSSPLSSPLCIQHSGKGISKVVHQNDITERTSSNKVLEVPSLPSTSSSAKMFV